MSQGSSASRVGPGDSPHEDASSSPIPPSSLPSPHHPVKQHGCGDTTSGDGGNSSSFNSSGSSNYYKKKGKKTVVFRTNFSNTVLDGMLGLGWERTTEETGWDIFWCDISWIREKFDSSDYGGARGVVNHFRTYYELTRKDMAAKNIKRYRRALERGPGGRAAGAVCDFQPATYWLPHDYRIFVEDFKRRAGSVWIMKPVGSAQGKGIFLISKLSQLAEFKRDMRFADSDAAAAADTGNKQQAYIVQQYVERPYLIGGRKFDMRIYVLVTSFMPLRAWLYREGFARFSGAVYSSNKRDLGNAFMHLTNVAVQKQAEGYDSTRGCKWLMSQVRRYLAARHGEEATAACMRAVDSLIATSLRAVQPVMNSDPRCFELYGFDVLFDDELKPWLIEVNASPSLTADTPDDYELKVGLIEDTMAVLDLEGRRTGQERRVGGFDLMLDAGKEVTAPAIAPTDLIPPPPNTALGGDMTERRQQLIEMYAHAERCRRRQQQR